MQHRRNLWIALGVLGVAAVIAAIAVFVVLRSDDGDSPDATATAMLDAWERKDTRAVARLTTGARPEVRSTYQRQADDLGAWPSRVRLIRVTKKTGDTATARFAVTFRLGPDQIWRYRGNFALARTDTGWRVVWRAENIHPDLTPTTHFRATREFGARAQILAEDGTPLTGTGPFVVVGAEPQRITDRAAMAATLQEEIGLDPAVVDERLDAPGVQPNYFVELATIPNEQYEQVKPTIYPIPGLLFRRIELRAAATPQLIAHVVGSVGPITAELLDELGPPYRDTDTVGRTGLERAFETRLAGTPTVLISRVSDDGTVDEPVTELSGRTPQPVRTTLDLATQLSAEAAIGTTAPAAMVVTRPSDGAIRAVVSTPIDDAFDRALDGSYPPGSTFKVVTGAALLANGVTPDTAATCPPTITVNGRSFRNFEGETEASLSFRRAFAISCNTAFIGLAESLPDTALATAAADLGFGERIRLGLPASGGSFPEPKDGAERAAAAIGQARVTASPLTMAGVAGAVAAGEWRAPTLVLEPALQPESTPKPIDPTVAASLRSLMIEVVQNGTATAAGISGVEIGGKTGTAEFGNERPPPTHAWFIGFRGDLAFSVVAENGGVGGRVAAPIARAFLVATP